MDTAVKQVARLKRNKENSTPNAGPTKLMSRDVISEVRKPAPLRSKNQPKDETAGDETASRRQVKPPKLPESKDVTQRKTLSQAFRTEHTLRHRKLVLETQKPPSSAPPKPPLPGTYKGRVVKSKIDCFRKAQSERDKNPRENKPKAPSAPSRAGGQNSKSGAGARGNAQSTVPQRPLHGRAPAQAATGSAKPSMGSTKPPICSTRPSTLSTKLSAGSTRPSTLSTKPPTGSTRPSVISRKPVMMSARPPTVTSFVKKKEPLKPAAAASEKKPQGSVSGSISQYRIRVETAEERRLKLADWLASKGKTLKRPALTDKSVSQSRGPRLHAQVEAAPVPETEQNEVLQTKPAFSSSPSHILNTTLDLLDTSDTEPPAEPEIRMESLVMNLCERLEAMETPSSCRSQTKSEGNTEVSEEGEETPEYEILQEEELSQEPKIIAQVEKTEEEEEDEKKMMKAEERKLFEEEEESVDATAACVVKYSVKTTPFLRSVKQRMDGDMAPAPPASLRKSSIKELKFLTPVRRSSRIQRNSSRLPGMLSDHDPCVSSLAELELLDAADSNAYIYRKNPALLHHLPDQSSQHTGK